LVIDPSRGLHVELHLYFSLIVANWKAQPFDIVPDWNRQIDSATLPAIVGQQCRRGTAGQTEDGQCFTG
jgi:hypothetical protein